MFKLTPLEVWKEEALLKSVGVIADSKCYFEFLSMIVSLFENVIHGNSFCMTQMIEESLHHFSSILTVE